ncbi:MAG: epoxyqueuosine reductase QueH [Kiritimatiellae bacterium]|nr:epoxyqueuosine reductase QueH [Kiritimatiellia bacterium]
MSKVLLHTCCGPCASACAPVLREQGHDVALFFSNSNIDTEEEFVRRLENARVLGKADGVEVVADAYDHGDWLEHVAKGFEDEPEKGARCARCFRYSLARAAAYAAAHGYDAFTTSLTVSPHKVSKTVFEAGEDAAWSASAKSCGGSAAAVPAFLKVDFKKKDGFLRSLRRSAELGLYRQPYCGCEFSRRKSADSAISKDSH